MKLDVSKGQNETLVVRSSQENMIFTNQFKENLDKTDTAADFSEVLDQSIKDSDIF